MSRQSLTYVALQFVCSAALVLSVQWRAISALAVSASVLGGVISVVAVLTVRPRQVSVASEVKAEATLVRSGPYRWIRHPMYVGLILFTLGFVFASFHWWKLAVWVVLIVVLHLKAAFEERLLAERFPEYDSYRKVTKRFVPFIY